MVSIHRHVAVVESMLNAGETVRFWVQAHRAPRDHVGALMVSDQRVLWSGLGAFTQSQDTFPFTALRNARLGPVEHRRTGVLFDFAGTAQSFSAAPSAALRVVDGIRAEQHALGIEPDAEIDGSVVERLERLVALRDAGVLDAAEFDRAKKQVLE